MKRADSKKQKKLYIDVFPEEYVEPSSKLSALVAPLKLDDVDKASLEDRDMLSDKCMHTANQMLKVLNFVSCSLPC